MSGIVDFLEARIAEDEAAMELRGDFPHSIHSYDVAGTYNANCPDCRGLAGTARALAECAAKRAIIAEHGIDDSATGDWCETCAAWWDYALGEGPPAIQHPCPTLKAVAAVYKDHPDYQQEWASA